MSADATTFISDFFIISFFISVTFTTTISFFSTFAITISTFIIRSIFFIAVLISLLGCAPGCVNAASLRYSSWHRVVAEAFIHGSGLFAVRVVMARF